MVCRSSSPLAGVHASFGRHAYVFAFIGDYEGEVVTNTYVADWQGILTGYDQKSLRSVHFSYACAPITVEIFPQGAGPALRFSGSQRKSLPHASWGSKRGHFRLSIREIFRPCILA